MKNSEIIDIINETIRKYFADPSHPRKIRAKELIPEFIFAGAFKADHKNGLEIRNLLRDLDKKRSLSIIPYVLAEKGERNTHWFFVDTKNSPTSSNVIKINEKDKTKKRRREDSDEYYVISLCNELLHSTALQQHRFEFLKGDGENGKLLPVDAYYEHLNLVVEYHECQHTESIPLFNKSRTISGVSRDEQRRIYDERRLEILPKHGIKVVIIDYSDFGNTKKIKRNHDNDIIIVRQILEQHGVL